MLSNDGFVRTIRTACKTSRSEANSGGADMVGIGGGLVWKPHSPTYRPCSSIFFFRPAPPLPLTASVVLLSEDGALPMVAVPDPVPAFTPPFIAQILAKHESDGRHGRRLAETPRGPRHTKAHAAAPVMARLPRRAVTKRSRRCPRVRTP